MGAAVGVILIKERHIVEAFERIGATSAERARTLDELADAGVHAHGVAWHALRNRVVIREAADGRLYLDMEVWQSMRRRRRHVLFIVAIAVLAIAVLSLLTGGHVFRP